MFQSFCLATNLLLFYHCLFFNLAKIIIKKLFEGSTFYFRSQLMFNKIITYVTNNRIVISFIFQQISQFLF